MELIIYYNITLLEITENENHAVNVHLINQFDNNIQNKTKHSYSGHWLDFIRGKKNNDPENSKLRTYCKFKGKLEIENYLLMIDDKQYRFNFTKLRVSSHKLMIETGRHNKPKKIKASKRFCTYCNN